MKVLVLTTYPPDDASRRLRIDPLVQELTSRHHDVKVHTLLTGPAFRSKNRPIGKAFAGAVLLPKTFARLAHLRHSVDVCLIHREAFPFFTPWVEAAFRSRCRILVIDVDDAVDESPTHGHDWRKPLRKPSQFRAALRMADLAICGSPDLARKYSKFTKATFAPTCPPRILVSDSIRDPNLLCWIGSQSTLDSLIAILPDILESCRQLGLRLEVIGGRNVESLPDDPALRTSVWTPAAENDLLSRATVGLMPLPDTEWERGKGAYKCLLYMSAGVVPVISPVGMNSWLSHQYEEIVVAEDDWGAAIAKARRSAEDVSVRMRLREIIERDYNSAMITAQASSQIESVFAEADQGSRPH